MHIPSEIKRGRISYVTYSCIFVHGRYTYSPIKYLIYSYLASVPGIYLTPRYGLRSKAILLLLFGASRR